MTKEEYAEKLVDDAKNAGEAASDIDGTVVAFKNGEWVVFDNGEAGEATNRADAVRMVVENLEQAQRRGWTMRGDSETSPVRLSGPCA